jgi:hypothetical protein
LSRDVTVHPLHRIGSRERETAGQHFVERNTEGVKVTAGIDGAIHSSRLLGRHVGERPGKDLGRLGRLALAWEARRDAESGESDPPCGRINDYVGWLDVLVDETTSMQPTERAGQSHCKSEKLSDLHRLTGEAIERLTSCVVDNEHALPAIAYELHWLQRPRAVQVLSKFVFVSESIDALERRMLSARMDGYESVPVTLGIVARKPAKDAIGVFPQNF